jgi:hypothetical protein
MPFKLFFTQEASEVLDELEINKSMAKILKAVKKSLGYLESNPRHPGLNTHKFSSIKGPDGQEVFEAYAQNNTPAAYRIFWCYGPQKQEITIITITAHP